MNLEKNVGGMDRLARAAVGVVLLVAGAAAFGSGSQVVGVVALVGAAGLLFNAATQFCGLNALLGIDTCDVERGEVE